MKLAPNQPCWCNSGKKFKKCHMNRNKAPKVKKSDLFEVERTLRANGYCMHPDADPSNCGSTIVKAHTLQRNGVLNLLADSNKVMTFPATLSNVVANDGKLKPKPVSIRKASTFSGFCDKHDAPLFAPIETQRYTLSGEQHLLLALRSVTRELFMKRLQNEALESVREMDRGTDEQTQQDIQNAVNAAGLGVDVGQRELERDFDRLNTMYRSRDYSQLAYCALELDAKSPLAVSSVFCPEFVVEGQELQDLSALQVPAHSLTVNTILGDSTWFIVFVWFADEVAPQEFVSSLLRANSTTSFFECFVRMSFEFFNNIYFEQPWWTALASDVQDDLIRRQNIGLSMTETHDPKTLISNGMVLGGPAVMRIYSSDTELTKFDR